MKPPAAPGDSVLPTLVWSRGRMVVTLYGVIALTFMMTMYALEARGPRYVAGFALGCALSSSYGFLSGAWPFGVVEAVWAVIAVRRFRSLSDSIGGHA